MTQERSRKKRTSRKIKEEDDGGTVGERGGKKEREREGE